MANFPTGLVERVQILDGGIGRLGDTALARIQEKGFTVATGLTEYFAGAISVMASQDDIREYCPKDATEARFGSLESTEKWLQKGSGRAMFLLLSNEGRSLEGYGWSGLNPIGLLPDHPITTAFRRGERVRTKGLGPDFIQAVVSGTSALFALGEGIGLETWESNRAERLYRRLGFKLITHSEPELRPTINPDVPGGQILDRRLYMGYPSELLAE